MKLPKVPKTAKVTGVTIQKGQVSVDLSQSVDGVYLHGRTYIEEDISLTCSYPQSADDEETKLKRVIIDGGLVPMAKDIESFHLRVRRDQKSVMIVRFHNGGYLELDEFYPSIAWETETVKTEVTA